MDWKYICELNSSKIHVLNSKAEDHLKCFCTYQQLIFLDISWVVLLCKTLANFVQSIILRKERFVNNLKWEKESLNFSLTTEASQSERWFSITNMPECPMLAIYAFNAYLCKTFRYTETSRLGWYWIWRLNDEIMYDRQTYRKTQWLSDKGLLVLELFLQLKTFLIKTIGMSRREGER